MSKWILKTAVQRVISCLPQSHKVNALFQRYVTKGLHVKTATFEAKVADCKTHLENYYNHSVVPKKTFKVLELGTGWWPILPIGLYLCGGEEIWTYDISRWLQPDTFHRVLSLYCDYHQDNRLGQMLPRLRVDRADRLPELLAMTKKESPEAILELLKIHALIRDARHTDLPSNSIDLVYSNLCLEHVAFSMQVELHQEFSRVAGKDSVSSHYVGIGDQYANFDRSISMFNYMKFTAKQWRFLDNPIIPQTRLRACDCRRAIEAGGFEVVMQKNITGSKEDLAKITLAPEFRHYSEEDLLTNFTWLAARPR